MREDDFIPDEMDFPDEQPDFDPEAGLPDPPHPINWNLLSSLDLEAELLELNRWVDWLRRTYGLPASVIPPLWHRHSELLWELSALHLSWLAAYDPEQHASAPLGWHRDFADARNRLREWVSTAGCRLDRDRPTRQTTWPGEPLRGNGPETEIVDRYADFLLFVRDDVTARRAIEHRVHAVP